MMSRIIVHVDKNKRVWYIINDRQKQKLLLPYIKIKIIIKNYIQKNFLIIKKF